MLEKMPRMVCLPEPGSMWTPSHVSQARSCGLECTNGAGRGHRRGANDFSWSRRLRAASWRGVVCGRSYKDIFRRPERLPEMAGRLRWHPGGRAGHLDRDEAAEMDALAPLFLRACRRRVVDGFFAGELSISVRANAVLRHSGRRL